MRALWPVAWRIKVQSTVEKLERVVLVMYFKEKICVGQSCKKSLSKAQAALAPTAGAV